MRTLRLAIVLLGFLPGPVLACHEECAAGFVFDDAQGTCVRVTTS